ncbi:tRNA pseudouridine synthase B [Ruminococcaceae bacterium R-25]|nr:tRNA pseudouridine synthase B [Ruminococcaceae bacterium R-25]SUQ11923.1 tRNA pseudouridine synthase B [Oscillospiraceae bacterium]
MIQDGFILVDKPEGWTSFKTDRFVGKLLGTRKVGHLGTLDPFATGLLPVFAGKGLKYLRFCEGFDKGYSCKCVFGAETDTMDKTGEITSENYPSPEALEQLEKSDYKLIRDAVLKVKETKEQLPPAYSAKKIDGVKAYELARKGEMPDLKPAKITIYSLDITGIEKREKGLAIDFDCLCSKGTYIRTICSDLGSITGYGAYAETLRRTVNGQFNVKDAFTPDMLEKMAEAGDFSFVRDASETVSFLPEIKLDQKQTKDIKFGRKIDFPIDVKLNGDERIYYRATSEDKLIAVVFPAMENGILTMRIERLFAHD